MSYTTDRFNTANQTASFNATSSVTINILTTVNVDVGSDQQLFSGDSVTINISDPKALFTLSDTISISPLLVVNFTNNSIPIPLLYNGLVNDSIPAYYNSTDPSHTFLFVGRYPITLTVTNSA